jgi:hypothetical protein
MLTHFQDIIHWILFCCVLSKTLSIINISASQPTNKHPIGTITATIDRGTDSCLVPGHYDALIALVNTQVVTK